MYRRFVVLAVLAVVAVAAAFSAAPGTAGTSADRCLRGDWRMSNAAANRLLQQLIGNPQLRVRRGVLTAAFDAREMRYGSTDFVVVISLADAQLEGVATFINELRYTTRAGRIVIQGGTTELNISKFTGTKNGRTITVPGPPPTSRTVPAGGATPYTCSRSTLRWRIPVNNTWATFQRVR